jgi:hypothetical protein
LEIEDPFTQTAPAILSESGPETPTAAILPGVDSTRPADVPSAIESSETVTVPMSPRIRPDNARHFTPSLKKAAAPAETAPAGKEAPTNRHLAGTPSGNRVMEKLLTAPGPFTTAKSEVPAPSSFPKIEKSIPSDSREKPIAQPKASRPLAHERAHTLQVADRFMETLVRRERIEELNSEEKEKHSKGSTAAEAKPRDSVPSLHPPNAAVPEQSQFVETAPSLMIGRLVVEVVNPPSPSSTPTPRVPIVVQQNYRHHGRLPSASRFGLGQV